MKKIHAYYVTYVAAINEGSTAAYGSTSLERDRPIRTYTDIIATADFISEKVGVGVLILDFKPIEPEAREVQEDGKCPYCGRPDVTTPYCPHCGVELNYDKINEAAKKSREEALTVESAVIDVEESRGD